VQTISLTRKSLELILSDQSFEGQKIKDVAVNVKIGDHNIFVVVDPQEIVSKLPPGASFLGTIHQNLLVVY